MPLTNEFLPHHPLVFSTVGCWDASRKEFTFQAFIFLSSVLDRQTGRYIINPVGNDGFSSKARCDIAKLKCKTSDNDDDNLSNERSYLKLMWKNSVTPDHVENTPWGKNTVVSVHSSDRLTAFLWPLTPAALFSDRFSSCFSPWSESLIMTLDASVLIWNTVYYPHCESRWVL